MDFVKWMYEPTHSRLNGSYDLVIPLDYGTLTDKKILPKATLAGLEKAISLVKEGVAHRIAWASMNLFGVPLGNVNQEKAKLLESYGLSLSKVHSMVDCTNTITEAEQIIQNAAGLSRIIVICDWRHARRAKLIWQHFFKGDLAFVTTNTTWDESHSSILCRSDLGWLVGNLIHHPLILLMGVGNVRKVRHPVANPNP